MKKCCFNTKRDMLSYLPDPIRSHIVSFLPMKDAMRTSVLSKQWKNVCSSLSQLEFNQIDFTNRSFKVADFKDFVDEMLIRHDGSDIQKFRLKIRLDNVCITSRRVFTWIAFALQHNVQDLELDTNYTKLEKFPIDFFTCSSLTVLSLVTVKIEWPKILRFPVLRKLYLEQIEIKNEDTIDKLFSSSTCPVLEELLISVCILPVHTLFIRNPSLKYFYIIDANCPNINISVSTLRKLDCIHCELPNISSETLSSLCNAYFDLYYTSANIISHFNRVSKILTGLHNVEKLHLTTTFIELLSRGRELLPASLPSSYCSLKNLWLDLFPTSIHVQVMKLLLRSYPSLQTLKIAFDSEEYDWYLEDLPAGDILNITDVEDHWQLKKLPAGDILNSLGMVEIIMFKGLEIEIELVRFLLENAKFLENMIFSYPNYDQESADSQRKQSEILSTFAGIAPNATISLSNFVCD